MPNPSLFSSLHNEIGSAPVEGIQNNHLVESLQLHQLVTVYTCTYTCTSFSGSTLKLQERYRFGGRVGMGNTSWCAEWCKHGGLSNVVTKAGPQTRSCIVLQTTEGRSGTGEV